eukprot:scaffold289543_cov79-Cyclotella_meneghiniana.AAC.3
MLENRTYDLLLVNDDLVLVLQKYSSRHIEVQDTRGQSCNHHKARVKRLCFGRFDGSYVGRGGGAGGAVEVRGRYVLVSI